MLIDCFTTGPFETNVYVLGCEKTKEAAIVDPSFDALPLIRASLKKQSLTPKIILLTHSHLDHIADAARVKETFAIPLYVHRLDAKNLEEPGSDGLPLFFPIRGVSPTGYFDEGDSIEIGECKGKVIHTPGHTPGGVCFFFPKEQALISGDTLFQGTIGNLSFPTAEPEKMWASLKKLAALPPATRVFPGHGPSTTIGEEHWLMRAEELFG